MLLFNFKEIINPPPPPLKKKHFTKLCSWPSFIYLTITTIYLKTKQNTHKHKHRTNFAIYKNIIYWYCQPTAWEALKTNNLSVPVQSIISLETSMFIHWKHYMIAKTWKINHYNEISWSLNMISMGYTVGTNIQSNIFVVRS